LGVEQLEDRRVFAGVVDVQVTLAGDLVVTGDAAANSVQIYQTMQNGQPVRGSYYVVGLNAGGAPTTITGDATPEGVTHDIKIDLKGGNDTLLAQSVKTLAANDVTIDLGEGTNAATLDNLVVAHNLTISGGNATDRLMLRGLVVGKGTNDGNVAINTRGGNDVVEIDNFFVRGTLDIDTGAVFNSDVVRLNTGNVGRNVSIRTGDGGDVVIVSNVGVNHDLILNTGGESDIVQLDRVNVDQLFAALGSGNDSLSITNSFGRRASLNGGADFDTLNAPGTQFTVVPVPIGFE
jgi:hypothetical protein